MNKCPYCGSKTGVYKTYVGKQYYDFDGEPAGFYTDEPEIQNTFVRCIDCERKISMKRILKEKNSNGEV